MRVQRTGVAAFAAFCVLLLAGCGFGPGRSPAPDATPADRIVCGTGLGDDLPDQPPAGRVPAGFTVVAAHICDPSASREDEAGIWSGVLVQRLEGDLTPALTALARPDDPRWAGPCTAVVVVAPDLWIEGADGRVIRVSFPVDGCGQPKTEDVLFALGLLTVVEERFEPLSLIESRAARPARNRHPVSSSRTRLSADWRHPSRSASNRTDAAASSVRRRRPSPPPTCCSPCSAPDAPRALTRRATVPPAAEHARRCRSPRCRSDRRI